MGTIRVVVLLLGHIGRKTGLRQYFEAHAGTDKLLSGWSDNKPVVDYLLLVP